jgi:hypothetical protein
MRIPFRRRGGLLLPDRRIILPSRRRQLGHVHFFDIIDPISAPAGISGGAAIVEAIDVLSASGNVSSGATTPSRTGTAAQVDASGGDGSTSITVPGDCNAIIAYWAHEDSPISGASLTSLAVNSAPFTIQAQLASGVGGDTVGVGLATIVNPSTGSRTFEWTWDTDEARAGGGLIILVFVKDANTGDLIRGVDVDATESFNAPTATASSVETDFVLGFGNRVTGDPGITGTAFIDNVGPIANYNYDATEVTAGDPSTAVTDSNPFYSSVGVISLKQS